MILTYGRLEIWSKVRIYKTAVRTIPTYAVKTQTGKTNTENMMRAAKMKTLRTIEGMI